METLHTSVPKVLSQSQSHRSNVPEVQTISFGAGSAFTAREFR